MIRQLFNAKINRYKGMSVLFLSVIVTLGWAAVSYSNKPETALSSHIIRLHVIANSDTDEDQKLKRQVRDKILDFMRGQLEESPNLKETEKFIGTNLKKIEEVSEKEIKVHQKNYAATASYGNYHFPNRIYGDVLVPEGNYQALRVVIGEGSGANWWCVLFPPLCFVDATHGVVSESMKEKIKTELEDAQGSNVSEIEEKEELPVTIKFKCAEWFSDTITKVSQVMTKIINAIEKVFD